MRDRIAGSLVSLSWIVLARGEQDRARQLYAEAVSIWDNLGTAVGLPQPGSPEGQPFQPLWFKEITSQRQVIATDEPD